MEPLSLIISMAAAAMVPPPPPGATVNCASPVYALDSLVCEDPALLKMDQEIGAFMAEFEPLEHPEAMIYEWQEVWFRRRAMCAKQRDLNACLRDAYAERAATVAVLREGNAATAGAPMRCDGLEDVTDVRVELHTGQAIVRDTSGAVLAVAMSPPASSWRPFVVLTRASKKTVAFAGDGLKVRCKPR